MIRFRVLGALDLRTRDGEDLHALLGQPKRIALLAYLALARPRGFHRRDTLLALFWPEDDVERARNSLSQSVHVLRRALGANILASRGDDALGLDPDAFWCDAVAFEEALDAARPADALELYGGDLLDGLHVPRAPDFERWLSLERARLAGRYAQVVEAVAEQRQRAEDFAGAVALWRQLATRDPYSSRIALSLMRALVDAGDPVGAVQHARVHETLLREEMGVAPDAAISILVQELRDERGRRARVPHQAVADARPVTAPAPEVADQPLAGRGPAPSAVASVSRWRWSVPSRQVLAAAIAFGAAFFVGGWAMVFGRGLGSSADPPVRSLAVLPFENLSGNPEHQPFVEGMHDALITELARYPELTIISRASALRYRNTSKPVPEIAEDLKVRALVQGAVLREGGRFRMTARLIDGKTDHHLWATWYERDLRDVLRLQAELAEAIARQVRVVVAPHARSARAVEGPADSVPEDLYLKELYLRGRHAELSRSLAGLQTAKEAYRRALGRDSTFALGYAGLAGVYGFLADYGFAAVQPSLDSARYYAGRAVALDSTLPETRTALAVTLADAGDFVAAEQEFKRAIEFGPSNARAHYWYSILLVALGRGEDAVRIAQRAAQLEPFAPRGLVSMQRYAHWLITGDRPYRRLPVRERRPILKLEPGEPWARAREAEDLAEAGRCPEARLEIERAQQLAPDNIRIAPSVGMVYWWCGQRRRARALLDEMKRRPDARDHGFRMAILHTLFGEQDSAFVWLERNRWTMAELSALSADHYLDPLRSDPRLARLMKQLRIR